ncbi:MAG: hypothetical protein WCL70_01855 [Paludibacter sp.]
MNKLVFKSIIISLFILSPIILFAQKDSVVIKRIPHQISVEFGYRNSFYQNTYLSNAGFYIGDPTTASTSQTLNSATHGVGLLVDYAWQLGGFNNKKPAIYLSIPMGYTIMLPDNPASKRISMLNYGWTIRHNLATSDKKLIPFVGYGLFLNNLGIDGVPGSVSGHQTQFEGGLNFSTATKLQYFVKIQGSYSSYPKLGYAKSLHFMYADLRFGVRL